MTLLSIGDRIEQGTYAFHSRFNRAVNFTNGNHLVSVVDEGIGAGPLNIVVRGWPFAMMDGAPSPLRVDANTIIFGNQRFTFTPRQVYQSELRINRWERDLFFRNLFFFESSLQEISPPGSLAFLLSGRSRLMRRAPSSMEIGGSRDALRFRASRTSYHSRARRRPGFARDRRIPATQTRFSERRHELFRVDFEKAFAAHLKRGIHEVFHGDLLSGVRILKGCGVGLTPSGDDFIAGLLIALNVIEKMNGRDFKRTIEAVYHTALGENIFSNTFLDLARRGFLFERMKSLIVALNEGGEMEVRNSAEKLFAVGASSGADLGTGFFMTLRTPAKAVLRWNDAVEMKHRPPALREPLLLPLPQLEFREATFS